MKLDNDTVQNGIIVVGALIGWLVQRIRAGRKQEHEDKWQKALETGLDLAESLALTYGTSKTIDEFQVAARGIIAVQLAHAGINADNPPLPVALARDLAIAKATKLFVQLHPSPTSLTMPGAPP
jgi:hypothetical protein